MHVLKRGCSRVLQDLRVNFLPAAQSGSGEHSKGYVIAVLTALTSIGVLIEAGIFWLLAYVL